MGFLWRVCFGAIIAQVLAAPPLQVPLQSLGNDQQDAIVIQEQTAKKRPLHGRFLHVTDFHPDRFYGVYTSTSEEDACHKGQGPAGIYGAESSDCDSPISLVNQTMDWIKKELRDKVDFVIWTGDSARHDNDEDHPRNEKQVVGLNELMVDKLFEVFGKHNGDEEDEDPNNDYIIPIIPTLGNNDILPHNIFRKGPNKWTRIYTRVWRQFIPEEQRHQFEQGGWFYVEVIPNKLAVFSLNTLYFFTSNAAADGCALPSEPGYQQMEWLRIQLQFMRDRGMKAILTGHVPPTREESKTNWGETCWQKYTLWLRQYRDVVVTSLYGHFNYDHFILQDFEDLRKGTKKGKMPDYETENVNEDDVHAMGKSDYFIDLRDRWSELPKPPKSLRTIEQMESELLQLSQNESTFPQTNQMLASVLKSEKKKRKDYLKKIGGVHAERYAASFVSASVVPNLYPTLRVFEYNITGLDAKDLEENQLSVSKLTDSLLETKSVETEKKKKKKKKKKKGKKKYKFEVPEPPSKSSPPGPAYSPQPFSLVRFTQYLANLTHINNDFESLSSSSDGENNHIDAYKWKEGKHKGKKPHNKNQEPSPKKFKYEVHYDTRDDDVYQLKDLTMPSIVDLATRIGRFEAENDKSVAASECSSTASDLDAEKKNKKKHKKKKKARRKQNEAWYTFVRRAFVETLSQEELHDEFGV